VVQSFVYVVNTFTADIGPTGPTGNTGVCDCTGDLDLGNVNIGGDTMFNGTVTCAMPLDNTCFGNTVCQDFSPCDSIFNNLRALSSLNVAAPGQPDGSGGLGNGAIEFVRFGRRDVFTIANQWNINTFTTYAIQAELAAITLLNLHSNGAMQVTAGQGMGINAGGPINMVSASGDSLIEASGGDLTLQTTSLAGTLRMSSVAAAVVNGPSVGVFASNGYVVGRSNMDPAFFSSYAASLFCTSGAPNAVRSAVRFSDDIVLEPAVSIISSNADNYARIGPNVEICNGNIRSSGSSMQLQDDIDTKIINVAGNFTSAVPNRPITFSNPMGGVNFAGTPIFDSTGPLTIGSDILISGTFTADDIVINNQLDIGTMVLTDGIISGLGTINSALVAVTGDVTCGGGMCSCDMRAKRGVQNITQTAALDRILSLEPIEYSFQPWFEEAKQIPSGKRYRGFSAQKAKKIVPQSVLELEETIGTRNFTDFHHISKQEMVPDLVGSIHALHSMIGDNRKTSNLIAHRAKEEAKELYKRLDQEKSHRRNLAKRVLALENKLKNSQDELHKAIEMFKESITTHMSGEAFRMNQVLNKAELQNKKLENRISKHATAMKRREGELERVLKRGNMELKQMRTAETQAESD